ncbi:hypothetical protein GOP47_0025532 [Adiantum capillus-veneris]|uniref:Uncharacterized protein n=1 Tax=Adiantum capillus-veneris TaxID=13818 RepID=A0A9D4Z2B6_ADICA|nr:hypothetical protein GOP47_0025532 [Adiantum capillus-veneris]
MLLWKERGRDTSAKLRTTWAIGAVISGTSTSGQQGYAPHEQSTPTLLLKLAHLAFSIRPYSLSPSPSFVSCTISPHTRTFLSMPSSHVRNKHSLHDPLSPGQQASRCHISPPRQGRPGTYHLYGISYQGQEFSPSLFHPSEDALHAKGIDTIACIFMNGVFIMCAWEERLGVDDKVLVLSNGNRKASRVKCGQSRRYSLLDDDDVVKVLHWEEGGSSVRSGENVFSKQLLAFTVCKKITKCCATISIYQVGRISFCTCDVSLMFGFW